ncbi:MAG: SusC/RagA family TonB-linked outer membrane protein [Bacteroidaceae bacterium]|nr:SusC/RagA family TonB-linked outer membrane protein [Bacteroidaceae bacterium]
MKQKLLLLGACLLMFVGSVSAQKRVTGRVVDASGEPVIGATVRVDGTKVVTITDEKGNFTLNGLPASAKRVSVTYIGMETTTANVSGNMRIVMKQNDQMLDEAVVVGYGTARKIGTVVGSVAKVGSEKIENKPSANALDALQGQVAGFQVYTQTGDPGEALSGTSSTVRGSGSLTAGNTPLYVIDGAPTTSSILGMMSSEDIESITVLKGASATSVYGSRAANGVVYITTKKGRIGERAQVTIGQSIGWSSLSRRVGDVMSLHELLDFRMGIGEITPEDYATYKAAGVNTDWQKYNFNENVPTYQTNFSIRGGGDKTNYYVSASHFKQTGVVPGTKFKRITFRSNLESQPLEWLRFGANVGVSYDERNASSTTFAGSNYINGAILGTLLNNPYVNPYDENGNKKESFIGGLVGGNIYSPEAFTKYNPQHINDVRSVSSAYLQINPLKGLTIKSQLSMDASETRGTAKRLPSHPDYLGNGNVSESVSRGVQFTITNTAEYKFNVNDIHEIILLAGQEGIRQTSNGFGVSGSGQSNDFVATLGNALESPLPSSSSYEVQFLSFFGRADYSYADKYFANITVRNDASSRFGKNNKAATFVSGGVMWDMKREAFLRSVEWLDNLQFRADVGSTGNASIGNYDHLALVGNSQYGFNYAFLLGSVGNEDLRWEKQIQTSVGVDARIFNRANVGFSFYNRKTKDMLMSVPLGYYTGFGSIMRNVGEMTNRGIELTFDVDVVKTRDFRLNVHGNYNYNRECIDKLFNGLDEWYISGTSIIYQVGEGLNFYMPIYAGVDKMTGEQMWYKKGFKGDVVHEYNPETMTKVFNEDELNQDTGKKVHAPHTGGFGITASWKGLTLNADFTYSLGKYLVNNDQYFANNPYQFGYFANQDRDVMNLWQQVGDITDQPAYGAIRQFDTHLLENASFMRLKNLSLSYELPQQWLAPTRILKGVRVTATARNLFTVTKYSGADPETTANISMGAYPNTRDFTIGAEITF